jgi:hypothetical protein
MEDYPGMGDRPVFGGKRSRNDPNYGDEGPLIQRRPRLNPAQLQQVLAPLAAQPPAMNNYPQYDPTVHRLTRISDQPRKKSGFAAEGYGKSWGYTPDKVTKMKNQALASRQKKATFFNSRGFPVDSKDPNITGAWAAEVAAQRIRNKNRLTAMEKKKRGRWQKVGNKYLLDPDRRRIRTNVTADDLVMRATGYDIASLTGGKKVGSKQIAKYLGFLGPSAIAKFVQFDREYYPVNHASRKNLTISAKEIADFVAWSVYPFEAANPDLTSHWQNRSFAGASAAETRARLKSIY